MISKTVLTHRVGGMAAAVLWAWLSIGCAGTDHSLPASAETTGATWIAGVPFFPDNGDECGPATLAGLLSFWGTSVDQTDLTSEIYDPTLHGTLPIDLLQAAAGRGFTADLVHGTMSALQAEITAGRPVIAQLNLGTGWLPIGHYILVTGFDEDNARIIAHSGTRPDRPFSYRTFLRDWNSAGNWMLTVRPAQRSMGAADHHTN
jgi:hypothetical protein